MDFDLDIVKIAVSALGAFGAAWLANRRENRQWREKQEAEQNQQLQKQADRLASGWSDMTAQARDIIDRLQAETIEAKTRAALAEERAAGLQRELTELRSRFDMARAELEGLRERGKRQGRRREPPEAKNEPGG